MRSFICNELEPFSYLIFMVALLLYNSRFKLVRYKVLALYNIAAAVVLYAGLVITAYLNNWTYNIVYLLNICVFSWYFYRLIESKQKQLVIEICLFINLLVFIYFNIFMHRFYSNFNSFVYGVVFMSIVLYTLLYLHQTLANVKEENLLRNFDFWLICLYLLYFLGSFVVVIYYERTDVYKRANIWAVANILLFMCAVTALIISIRFIKGEKISDG